MNLIPLGSNIWTAVQSLDFFGLEVGNRMTVIRLKSGALVLISPIQLNKEDCEKLNCLGAVSHIIVPNLLLHDLHVSRTQELYPIAKLWGVEGLAEKRPDLKIDDLLNQLGGFEDDLQYSPFEGLRTALPLWNVIDINETVFFHKPSRTLILTDVAFNFDEDNAFKTQIVARLLGCYKTLRPSWVEKKLSTNKTAIEASVRKILSWDFAYIAPAHGGIVEENGKAEFRSAFEWFLDKSLE